MIRTLRLCWLLILLAAVGCRHHGVVPAGNIPRAKVAAQSCTENLVENANCEAVAPIRPAANVLVLSGGGMYGAYSAGVLAGWTQNGTRPEFDVVTGVSTGSLIGVAAFLGPKYDPIAREFYTTIKASDVYTLRAWVQIPWADAVATSRPLKKLIDNVVDENLLAAVAREHRKGRRFYVGTTHLEARKLAVWDMGAIACQGPGAIDKFRDVLLASSSVPGVLPPVRLTCTREGKACSELHADGGTTASLFVPQGLIAPAPNGGPSGTNVYVIVAGKLFADPGKVRSRVLPVLSASANSIVYASARAEIATIHHLSRLAGANFHLTAVPAGDPADPMGLAFDPKEMSRLYEVGYCQTVSGPAWMTSPPFESSATDPIRE
ncbi:patatin-like phospholipase family protein [soil metagenome]